MADKSTEFPLKVISGLFSVVTFLADLITVGIFIKNVFFGEVTFTSAITQVAVIVVVFSFATLLWLYSRREGKVPDLVFAAFSWVYITLSATILAIVSQRFLSQSDYTFSEYLGYLILVFFIGGLGYFIYRTDNREVEYFAIPYMLVALEQAILWIFLIFSQTKLDFDWVTAGNISLFVVTGVIVLFFINHQERRWQIPLAVLISLLLTAGYVDLLATASSLWQVFWVIVATIVVGIGINAYFDRRSTKQ